MVKGESGIDPEMEAAIERALDAANLRAGESTATVIQPDPGIAATDDDASGDGD